MVYDVTDPASPEFVDYVNNRDVLGDPEAGLALDLGPEGIVCNEKWNWLIVTNEVSGTTTIYKVKAKKS